MGRSQVSQSVPPLPHRRCIRWALRCAVALCALSGTPAGTEDRVIQVANGAAPAGQSVQIPLSLSSLADFAGGDFVLSFNPEIITIQDADRTETTDDFLVAHGTPAPGLFSISMAASEGLAEAGSGVIALLTVQPNLEALAGTITTIVFREARWYDECSVRNEFLGDNGVFRVGEAVPEERTLTLSLSTETAGPGEETRLGFSVSMPEAIGRVVGDLLYDPGLLATVNFQPANDLITWQIDLTPLSGKLHFEITGPNELTGVDPLPLGDWAVTVSNTAPPGASAEVSLANLRVENLEGFAYTTVGEDAQVAIIGDIAAPTSTTTPTATPSPTPTPTYADMPPTQSPTPFVPADFDCNGVVDENDLIRFLKIWKQEAARK